MQRIILFVLGLVTATAAHGQTAYAGGSPAVLTVPVVASVGSRCGFADGGTPAGDYHKDNFDREGLSAQFDFALNCTGPARVAVLSSNGGLVASAAAGAGYINKADYSVTLRLAANDGSSAQATCAASALASGGTCTFGGAASTTQGLQLGAAAVNQPGSYIRVSAAAYSGPAVLVQGQYSDALTITVSPAL